jgi:hypothetical protein
MTISFGSPSGVENAGLSEVTLTLGPYPMPFVPRSFDAELKKCQRYYQTGNAVVSGYASKTGDEIGQYITFPTPMAISPTPTILVNPTATSNTGKLRIDTVSNLGFRLFWYAAYQGQVAGSADWTSWVEM